jgi:Flp pilus assembly protein TadG
MHAPMTTVRRSMRGRALRVIGARSGTAATEFALCIPLLLLMALACADFGRVAFFYEVVCNAARTGAETGATHKYTPFTENAWKNGVYQAALSEMQNIPKFNAGDFAYDLSTTLDSDNLAKIDVSVSYPFRTVVNWPGLPSNVLLHKQVEFHQFR